MKKSRMPRVAGAASVMLAMFCSSQSWAAVFDVAGDVILMARPASVVPDAPFSDTSVIHAFVERRGPTEALVAVDQAPEGRMLTIPAGTCVTVYMLHFDATTPSSARGRLELTTPILGVISTQLSLDLTNDTLGNTASGDAGAGDAGDAGDAADADESVTEYPNSAECQVAPPGSGNCGLEFNDAITLQPQSIELDLHANGPGDRVRVIAQCDP